MTYDADHTFDPENDDEALFQQYRKALRGLFDSIAAVVCGPTSPPCSYMTIRVDRNTYRVGRSYWKRPLLLLPTI